ncbi:MAG: zinc-binding dehydrogenase, partial [SAR324 cluster bacterium]|nr:zinc-binding dehydrogenase [SAR324 cluster bacterium]
AYTGLLNIGQPKVGETVVVAAASGAVGSVVGQIARIKGARAVGIAGSAEKCKYVKEELGFDSCVNHNSPDFAESLKAVCSEGIDVYFENVGGKVFETVSPLFNDFARIPVCGIISAYNATELPPGPNLTPLLMRDILVKRLNFRGFIVWDFAAQEKEALSELAKWIKEGKINYREDIVDGLENAPEAFIGLLEGKNFGKLVIRVSS